jgi:hypothetical protein
MKCRRRRRLTQAFDALIQTLAFLRGMLHLDDVQRHIQPHFLQGDRK